MHLADPLSGRKPGKPLDVETLLEAARSTYCMLTVEEHSITGSLGAAASEILPQRHPMLIKILGLPDEVAIHGKPLDIFAHYGPDGLGIYRTAKDLLYKSNN